MEEYYTVTEFAQLNDKDPGNIRRLLINGKLEGRKIGRQWLIPVGTEYPKDRRIKSGDYFDWRKKMGLNQANSRLFKSILSMCQDIVDIYTDQVVAVVLYGSYSRGEQTEESDIDIAVILNDQDEEQKHDRMIDVVLDYELSLAVTISVVQIDYLEYEKWRKVLPFYRNLDKEGIVLWKTA